jgi:transcriptional regulator with XRE-family HTH domain
MTPASIERTSFRTAAHVRDVIAADIARMRADAGLSLAAMARASGVDASYLARIEAGAVTPSVQTYARVAGVLGADLALRLYPNTGPAVRDRHQAGIVQALIATIHHRWRPFIEVPVRRPARGWIDVVLVEDRSNLAIAVEVQSELRRIEQLLRWSGEKAESLPSWDRWPSFERAPEVSSLLIVRATRTTRATVREFRRIVRAAYPADSDDAIEALTGTAPWPGQAMLWASGRGTSRDPWRVTASR